VREVWSFEAGRLTVRVLEGEKYEEAPRSRLLPALDLQQLVSFISDGDQTAAVRAYRRALRGS
jgi:hypothetical protein